MNVNAISGLLACGVLLLAQSSTIGEGLNRQDLIQLQIDDQIIQAGPIMANQNKVMMLGTDGRLWEFAPHQASNFTRLPRPFQPLSQSAMRGELLEEFGRGYEVSGTGSYLVVHPAGQKGQWADHFEKLYRSFHHYFSARGIRVERAEFPLVAIVLPNFAAYQQYAAAQGVRVSPAVVGFYSSATNRVALYDATGGNPQHPQWEENLATVIHEATHQTAFNCAIHSRFARQPKWIVEGLATMFEAPGVWDSRNHSQFRDRVNKHRLAEFLQFAESGRRANSLAQFIGSDRAYLSRPMTAYGEGWALVFFLVETRPREFSRYLQAVAARPAGSDYPSQERLKDFQTAFGDDLDMLESHFLRYAKRIPQKM